MAANLKNLRVPTSEEARKIGALGGKKSAESRKKRKTMREAYLHVCELPFKPIGDLAKEITDIYGEEVTVDEALMLAMIVKGTNGDVQACTFIRDTIGEKVPEKNETFEQIYENMKMLESLRNQPAEDRQLKDYE